jgi:hypothetical protein
LCIAVGANYGSGHGFGLIVLTGQISDFYLNMDGFYFLPYISD